MVPFLRKKTPNLLIQKLQKLLFGLLNVIFGSANEHFVTVATFWWELDADTTTFIHDGTDESALGANHSIVMFVRYVYLYLGYICLQ